MSKIINPQLAKLDITKMSQSEIERVLQQSQERFRTMVQGVARGKWNLVIMGEPGTGKTQLMMDCLGRDTMAYCKGVPSAVGTYKFLYRNRKLPVAVMDDCDHIYNCTEGTEILKAATESHKSKLISWQKQNYTFEKESVPQEFLYTGRMILISNKNLRRDTGKITAAQRLMAPVLDRCQVLLSGTPDVRWDIALIDWMARQGKIVCWSKTHKGIQQDVLTFLKHNYQEFRCISFRTVLKITELREHEPQHWQSLALESLE